MKLLIQIPCYNEAAFLKDTLSHLPRQMEGFDSVEWLVIDDGSMDGTAAVARSSGVRHIIRLEKHQGLARAFSAGLDAAVALGADVVINTDADNQYNAADIPALVKPILEGQADMVIGARPLPKIEDFSIAKKMLQKIGNAFVRTIFSIDIPDAVSGFRAMNRHAAMRLNVFSSYTYTLETLIQARPKNISITWVPIRVNKALRSSRLIKSTPNYLWRSACTIIRMFVVYQPFRFFITIGLVLCLAGLAPALRFVWMFFHGHGSGHIQSLVLSSILIGLGFQTIIVAFVADLMSINRRLLEDIQFRLKNAGSDKV